jgi:hypothetical protein
MLYIPGGIVGGGSLSGSAGGTVASRNRHGSYFRNRTIPVNPNTAQQQAVRGVFATLSANWNTVLSDAQRSAWETYAANVATTNRVGQQTFLTGKDWYVACNALRIQNGGTILNTAPTTFALAAYTAVTASASEATQQISVAYNNADDWAITTGGFLGAYASRPQSPGINYYRNPYRYFATEQGNTALPPTSPLTAAAPFAFVENQALFIRVNVGNADNRIGTPQRLRIIAAA